MVYSHTAYDVTSYFPTTVIANKTVQNAVSDGSVLIFSRTVLTEDQRISQPYGRWTAP